MRCHVGLTWRTRWPVNFQGKPHHYSLFPLSPSSRQHTCIPCAILLSLPLNAPILSQHVHGGLSYGDMIRVSQSNSSSLPLFYFLFLFLVFSLSPPLLMKGRQWLNFSPFSPIINRFFGASVLFLMDKFVTFLVGQI